jgi:hypothetical protein
MAIPRAPVALAILLLGLGALMGWAWLWRGAIGVRWAILAITICAVAGVLSFVASRFARGPQAALWTMLVGMGIRMTAALTACLVVNSLWRNGIDAGFGWYLVGAYLITLALDIVFLAGSPNGPAAAGRVPVVQTSGISGGVLWTEGERHG